MRRFLFICLLLAPLMVWAQADSIPKLTIRGVVRENQTFDPLEGAQVRLLRDSVQVTGAVVQKNGLFTLPNVPAGNYTLSISFIGYKEQRFALTLPRRSGNYRVKDVLMREDAKVMAEAVVEGKLAEMTVVDDTVMYNADAFKLQEGALVEELVEKLPGVVKNDDGSYTWNGKPVQQLLVDGKEFFGNNREIILKNLPADIVDKVKAYDKQSDYARITGVDDGEERTVLDFTIKKNKKRGWFGNIDGAYGTHDRYSGRVMVNRFIGDQKFSMFGNGNNTNGNGMTDNQSTGMTMNYIVKGDQKGAKSKRDPLLELNGSLSGNFSQGGSQSWRNSQNFENATAAYNNSWNKSSNDNKGLSFNYKVEWRPDSMTNVLIQPNLSWNTSKSRNASESAAFLDDPYLLSDDPLRDYLLLSDTIGVNHRVGRSHSGSNNFSVGGSVQVNRRLQKAGRNVTMNVDAGYGYSTSESDSYSQVDYYQILALTGGDSVYHKIQYNEAPSKNRNMSTRLSYTEPIGRQMFLQVSYQYSRRFTDRDRTVSSIFDWMEDANNMPYQPYSTYGITADNYRLWNDYAARDTDQCNYTTNTYQNHNLRVQYRINRTLYRLTIGANVQPQISTVDYTKGKKHYDVRQSVVNASPNINFRYMFSRQEQLEFRYNGNTGQPGITDLIPDTLSNADPLNIRLGNPELKPSFTHNMNASYRRSVVDKQRTSALNASFRTTQNSTTNRTEYNDVTGGRISKPVNINGNWNGSASFNFNTALGPEKYWRFNTNTNGSMTNAVSYVYQKATQQTVKNRTRGKNVSQSLRLSYRRDWETKYSLEVSTNGNIGYNHSRSTNSSASNLDTYHFSYGGSVNLQFPWGMSFWTDISEQSRRGYADHSMNTDKVIWNASISQRLLKQRNLTLSIRAYDILQQRDNISRNISATARTDSRNEAVNSYFLFSVNWRFGKFGGRSQNRMRGFDGERMREEGQRPEGRGMRGDGERPSIRVESGGGGFGGGMRGM
ncbi:MAG: outer membrane beta-barrel protein [Bacteroidaceae bacterium]|nr:outer membrane beta-barrel protein [Bacteroidaceae bacterium]